MTAARPHERFEELAVGHALAALEPGEEQEFLQHLTGCALCERALSEHLDTLSHLAYDAEPVPLPDGVLEGIRAGVRSSGRPSSADQLRVEPAEPVRLDDVRRRRALTRGPARWVGVAAAAALVLSLGVWNVSLQRQQSVTDQRTAALSSAVELLESPTTRRVALSDESGRAVAFAVLHAPSRVSLVVSGLPANDTKSSVYVLWQTGDAGTRPVGTFDVRADEVVVVRDLALAAGLPYSAFAVTHESGRKAPKAPGALPVANGSLAA